MSELATPGRGGLGGMSEQAPIRVRIGTLRVTATSGVVARRLADALPAAIERALRRPAPDGGPAPRAPADQVAAAVVAQIRAGGAW